MNMLPTPCTVAPRSDVIPETDFYPTFSKWLGERGVTSLLDMYCVDNRTLTEVGCFDIVGAFETATSPVTAGSNPHAVLRATRVGGLHASFSDMSLILHDPVLLPL